MFSQLQARLALSFSLLLAAVASLSAAPQAKVSNILFIGNSITRHGPSESLGWEGAWGMAATSEDKDYVHRVVARLAELQGSAPAFTILAEGGVGIPNNPEQVARVALAAKSADLAIIQLGENDRDVTTTGFQKPYENILLLLRKARPSIRIICVGTWSPPSGGLEKDAFIRELCAKHKLPFADLSAANRDPLNQAKSTGLWSHAGVGWHPSDAGMDAYAVAILKAFTAGDAAIPVIVKRPASTLPPGQPIFHETFKGPESAARWKPVAAPIEPGLKTNALKITSTDATKAVYFRHMLDTTNLNGRKVTVSARIKGEAVTAPEKPHNGVKLMLTLLDAEGKSLYPQAPAALTGNFAWKDITFSTYIPDTTATATLVIGTEFITGTLWIEDIKIVPTP